MLRVQRALQRLPLQRAELLGLCGLLPPHRHPQQELSVQPRRDGNVGRRKLTPVSPYPQCSPPTPKGVVVDPLAYAVESSGIDCVSNRAESFCSNASTTGSVIDPPLGGPQSITIKAHEVFQALLEEERLLNERKRIMYCERDLDELVGTDDCDDITVTKEDLRPLKFAVVRRDIRPMILVAFEWLRIWPHYKNLSSHDKKVILRRCVLYQALLEPTYLTYRLGYPKKFVMPNCMTVSITDDSNEGWEDEDEISAEMKRMLYHSLMTRAVHEIVEPMNVLKITHIEYILLKAIISWKGALSTSVSAETKDLIKAEIDYLLAALNIHYHSLNYAPDTIAERTGNLLLLISSIFMIGMECIESHQKIHFFDLWQLDSLILKLLPVRRTSPIVGPSRPVQ
uniref:NR LBD domain-containing protein n=1 Tax=Steinernema glaseri TaxID=37863 RepID=A0A1I8AGQ6_9BILA